MENVIENRGYDLSSLNGKSNQTTNNSSRIPELSPEEIRILDGLQNPDDGWNTEFRWGEEFQRHILSAMLHDKVIMEQAGTLVKSGYFTNEVHQLVSKITNDYWTRYNTLPENWYITQEIVEQTSNKSEKQQNHFRVEFNAVYHYYKPGVESRDAILAKLIDFAKVQATKAAFTSHLDAMKNGKFAFADTIKKLESVQQLGSATDTECFDLVEYRDYAESIKRAYLVDEWLLAGSLTVFAGQQKLGKSTLMFALVGALLGGDRWLDKFDVTQSQVLYFDFENPADYVWENLVEYLPVDRLDEIGHLFKTPKAMPSALTPEWLKKITEKHQLADQKGLLIVDSGRAAFNGLFTDVPNWENSQGPVRSALEPLQKFARESGWAVVVIHHDNKSGGFSGSSDWEAVPDYIWRLERSKEGRKLKMRGRLKVVPAAQVVKKNGDRIEFVGSVAEIASEEAEIQQAVGDDKVLSLLSITKRTDVTVENGMTVKQLAELSKMPDSSVRRHLNRLLELDPESGRRVSVKQLESTTGRPPKVYFREPMLAV